MRPIRFTVSPARQATLAFTHAFLPQARWGGDHGNQRSLREITLAPSRSISKFVRSGRSRRSTAWQCISTSNPHRRRAERKRTGHKRVPPLPGSLLFPAARRVELNEVQAEMSATKSGLSICARTGKSL
jgi:hypothetical protein